LRNQNDGLFVETYQEDSGNYTCEVSGPQNTLIGHVTHHIFVRGQPEPGFFLSLPLPYISLSLPA